MTSFAVLAFLLSGVASSATGRMLSDVITPCRASDPNLNECVKNSGNVLLSKLTEALDVLNLPVMDPLFTPMLELIENTKYAQIDLKYIDISQSGLSKMVIDRVDFDLASGDWLLEFKQPIFAITGKYKSKGTIMNMVINGDGEFNSTHYDTKIKNNIHVNRVMKDGVEYFKVDKFELDYTFGTAKMYYSGLFQGDRDMEKTTNDFLNENSHDILTDLKPALEQVYSELFRGYVDSIMDKVPASTLFPQD